MKTFNIKMLVILFVILIILLALSVYIKPLLELYTSEISVDISGQTYTGTVSNKQQYEIDISGVMHTGFIDVSGNNFGEQPQIVNQNFVVAGQSGRALNDIYMPGTTGTSGGQYTSPLDFLSNFYPTTGMYTAVDVSANAGGLLPTSNDASQTSFGIPEAEESQLGTLGVDYNLRDFNDQNLLTASLAQIYRDINDDRLPISSKMNTKSSDIVGEMRYNFENIGSLALLCWLRNYRSCQPQSRPTVLGSMPSLS